MHLFSVQILETTLLRMITVLFPGTGLSVSWQQSEYMVSESNEPLMVCAEIAAGSLERGVSVSVQAESGTALAGMCSKFGKIALKWHWQWLN